MPRPKPSPATAHKARFRANRIKERREANYCEPVSISPNRVVYFYAGYEIAFEDRGEGVHRVDPPQQTYQYLNEEDFAFLYQEAERLMKANRRSIAEARARKGTKAEGKRKKNFDPNQTRLIL